VRSKGGRMRFLSSITVKKKGGLISKKMSKKVVTTYQARTVWNGEKDSEKRGN